MQNSEKYTQNCPATIIIVACLLVPVACQLYSSDRSTINTKWSEFVRVLKSNNIYFTIQSPAYSLRGSIIEHKVKP